MVGVSLNGRYGKDVEKKLSFHLSIAGIKASIPSLSSNLGQLGVSHQIDGFNIQTKVIDCRFKAIQFRQKKI